MAIFYSYELAIYEPINLPYTCARPRLAPGREPRQLSVSHRGGGRENEIWRGGVAVRWSFFLKEDEWWSICKYWWYISYIYIYHIYIYHIYIYMFKYNIYIYIHDIYIMNWWFWISKMYGSSINMVQLAGNPTFLPIPLLRRWKHGRCGRNTRGTAP